MPINKKNSQIIVLGARESGLPAVVRLIASMGAWAGHREDIQGDIERGRDGHWQHVEVRGLNDRLLEAVGRSWSDLGEPNLNRIPGPPLDKFRNDAARFVSDFDSHGTWVVGDPRLSVTFDCWKPLLNNPLCVLIHRKPETVARLMHLRHGFSLGDCLHLWEQYNLAALRSIEGLPHLVVRHEHFLGDRYQAAMHLYGKLFDWGAEDLHPIRESALQSLVDQSTGMEPMPLSHNQSALARHLKAGTEQSGSARTPLTLSGGAHDGRSQSNRRPMVRARSDPEKAHLEFKLLRRNEELGVLRKEVAKLRGASRKLGSADATHRSRGVFVIGSPRSGTSVFSWALAQHPNFHTSAESDFLLKLFGKGQINAVYEEAHARADTGWLKKERVDFSEFASNLGLGAEVLFQSRARGARWVDATPGYTLMTDELLRLFPAASLLHIVRDGRAVVNSMICSGFNVKWASNFKAACKAWAHYALLGHKATESHPNRVLEVRYEELMANTEVELTRIFEFLGERSHPRSVALIARGRINSSYGNEKPEDIKLAKDPNTAPKRPWESWNSEQHRVFNNVAGDAMSLLGYQVSTKK